MSDLDDQIKTRFENDKHRFAANVVFTANWIKNRASETLVPFGVSMQQFNILRILRGAGDWVSMNDIKKLMIDKSPHTTRMTTKLLDKDFVKRRRSEKDRRVVFVALTDKGADLLKEIDEVHKREMNFMDKISIEEARLVNAILDRVRN